MKPSGFGLWGSAGRLSSRSPLHGRWSVPPRAAEPWPFTRGVRSPRGSARYSARILMKGIEDPDDRAMADLNAQLAAIREELGQPLTALPR